MRSSPGDVQTCVIHLIRNTFKYASKKYWGQIATDLKPIYGAHRERPHGGRRGVRGEVGQPYPAISSCGNAWEQFTPFLDYDVEIRTVLCSTNAIESFNARYRRAVTVRGRFPTEQAAMKCLYLVTRSLDPEGTGQHDGRCGGSQRSTPSPSPSPTVCPRPRTTKNENRCLHRLSDRPRETVEWRHKGGGLARASRVRREVEDGRLAIGGGVGSARRL